MVSEAHDQVNIHSYEHYAKLVFVHNYGQINQVEKQVNPNDRRLYSRPNPRP